MAKKKKKKLVDAAISNNMVISELLQRLDIFLYCFNINILSFIEKYKEGLFVGFRLYQTTWSFFFFICEKITNTRNSGLCNIFPILLLLKKKIGLQALP